jgi:hypothetical protein
VLVLLLLLSEAVLMTASENQNLANCLEYEHGRKQLSTRRTCKNCEPFVREPVGEEAVVAMTSPGNRLPAA